MNRRKNEILNNDGFKVFLKIIFGSISFLVILGLLSYQITFQNYDYEKFVVEGLTKVNSSEFSTAIKIYALSYTEQENFLISLPFILSILVCMVFFLFSMFGVIVTFMGSVTSLVEKDYNSFTKIFFAFAVFLSFVFSTISFADYVEKGRNEFFELSCKNQLTEQSHKGFVGVLEFNDSKCGNAEFFKEIKTKIEFEKKQIEYRTLANAGTGFSQDFINSITKELNLK